MIITISGTAGSGKSSVAKELAIKLNYKHYSMGDFQRELAKAKGLSIVQMGELEKIDPGIDKMVDDKQIKLGEEEDNFVIDSWLSAHFIPKAFKIFMDAKIEIRASRITQKREAESYETKEEALAAINKREETNRSRFLEFYNYDYMNMENYDLVIDTDEKDINGIVQQILEKINV